MKFKWIIYSFFFVQILPTVSHTQNNGIGTGIGMGYTIPNHPRFPLVNAPSVFTDFEWIHDNPNSMWSKYNSAAKLHLSASFQTLGNNQVMGVAMALTPFLSFPVIRKKHFCTEIQLGWGAAWLSKKFDSFYNPDNIVIGTHLNASVAARIQFSYRFKNIEPVVRLSVQHYSNGNAMSPNLGFNIPLLQTGLLWYYKTDSSTSKVYKTIDKAYKRKLHPFFQTGLGISANISRGPFFPVYNISSGVQYLYHPSRNLWAGLEFSFNTSIHQFYIRNGSMEDKSFNRYAFWLGHEWFFGRIGFFTLGGIYLNKHVGQRSLIPTQTGLNFYPKLPYRYQRNQFWLGVHIRAYLGLADYVMIQLGYRF